jgi:hypothetical protein
VKGDGHGMEPTYTQGARPLTRLVAAAIPCEAVAAQPLPKDWRDELSPGTWVIACPSAQLDVFRPSVGRAAHAW